jgi:hypothetical protein
MAEIEYATEARAERIRSSYDGPQDIAPPAPLHDALVRLESGIDRIANAVERAHKELSPIVRETDQVMGTSANPESLCSPITQQVRHQADRANDLADQLMTLLGRIDI